MKVISKVSNVAKLLPQSKTVALIPTMGNLHDGHLALIKHAQGIADYVVVSIYVNPTQFGPKEDFLTYPRTMEEDQQKLTELKIDLLFIPTQDELYPLGTEDFTQIRCPALDKRLCSQTRPHFFTGVGTVVTKLLNIIKPQVAIFGEKDFQQLIIIRRICKELFITTEIIGIPTIRNHQGLALSSRNKFLNNEEKEKIAPLLYKTLKQTQQEIESKPTKAKESQFLRSLEEHAKIALCEYGFKVDYFDILSSNTLTQTNDYTLIIAAAVYLGPTRLIDNLQVEVINQA